MSRRAPDANRIAGFALAAALLLGSRAAPAHHSFAMFDASQSLTAVGTVKELQWGNPHTWLEMVVLNDDKSEKPLSLELNGLSGLRRNGWEAGIAETRRQGDGHLSSDARWDARGTVGAGGDGRWPDAARAVAVDVVQPAGVERHCRRRSRAR